MNSRSVSKFLGIEVDELTQQELNAAVERVIENGARATIANHNLHSLYLFHRSRELREFFHASEYVHADGMGIVLLSRLCGGRLRREHRTTYADWLPVLMRLAAEKHWRVFYVGSKPGVAERGARVLREQCPGLQIETHSGYFDCGADSAENRRVIEQIAEARPHLLLVGMGMPRQEHWIARNLQALECNAILTAGAAIDYVAGAVPTPPRWAGRVGFEWLFRLAAEPKRLSKRYLVEPWYVAGLLLRYWLRLPAKI